jgi:hypothetical protein
VSEDAPVLIALYFWGSGQAERVAEFHLNSGALMQPFRLSYYHFADESDRAGPP